MKNQKPANQPKPEPGKRETGNKKLNGPNRPSV